MITAIWNDPESDAIWVLSCSFITLSMHSGFGLLESGSVTPKNEVNIMVKNAADVIFGGLTYWMFGYAFSFGNEQDMSNSFAGWGNFFVMANDSDMGMVYSKFFFQASFATTATTIVSGAMAERVKLEAYILFSLLNTLVFCFPAHWIWGDTGWLRNMGAIDIAGAGPVHMVGGITGLTATLMLKPRHGRFDSKHAPQMGSPTNALLGLFMLWWGWLGFNCGSTFGISGEKWKLAARSAVSTITASMAGGMIGMLLSYVMKKRRFEVPYLINGILGALVGITGFCALAHPWEGFVIGAIGAVIAVIGDVLLNRIKIDDPVGVVPVHCISGIWSMLAVGLFARKDSYSQALAIDTNTTGLFYGGGFELLGIQSIAVLAIIAWSLLTSFIFLKIIDLTVGLRVSLVHEILGADIVEHSIGDVIYDKKNNKVIAIGQETVPDIIGDPYRNGNARRGSASSVLSFKSIQTLKRARRGSSVYGKHFSPELSNHEIDELFTPGGGSLQDFNADDAIKRTFSDSRKTLSLSMKSKRPVSFNNMSSFSNIAFIDEHMLEHMPEDGSTVRTPGDTSLRTPGDHNPSFTTHL